MRLKSGSSVRTASRVTKLLLYLLAGVATMSLGTTAQQPPLVRVDSGELQGVADDSVVSYKGIPFAAPPVRDLRWRPPQPAAAWTGVRQAAEFGADCMQARFGPRPPASGTPPAPSARPSPAASPERTPSEDCLFLNVWTPANGALGAKLPVMFWIYGAGSCSAQAPCPTHRGLSSLSRASCWSLPITAWAASGSSRSPR